MRVRFTDYDYGFSNGVKELIKVANQEFFTPKCKYCDSFRVVKYGHKNGIQRWWCKDCKRKFVDNKALPGMKTPVEQVAAANSMYYEGMSLNAIRRQFMQMYNYLPSDSTIYEWIARFTKEAIAEAKDQKPQVGDVWVADETMLKIGGQNIWFWDLIDSKSRFLLASHISMTRTSKDAKELVERAAKRAGKTPKTIITDKLAAYFDGIELAFGADTKHIASKKLTTTPGTQLIERFHSTLKARTKVMRGLKTVETAKLFTDGWLVHYNHFRNHESLNDRTPAQVASIKFPYRNWLDTVKAQQMRLSIPKVQSPTPVITPRTHRITPRRASASHRKPTKGGLYVGKQGQMSRHYFRGARRVV
ncbi:IS6 family transposase [Chloroflexota bacterium]